MIAKGTTSTGGVYSGTTEIAEVRKGTSLRYENFKTLTAENVPPLTVPKCKNTNLINYKIYGNTVQNNTPTPSNPVEIKSVGDKTNNEFKPSTSSPLSGVTVSHDNLTDIYTINGTTSAAGNIWLSNNFVPNISEGEAVTLTAEILSGTIDRNGGYIYYSMFNNNNSKYIRNADGNYLVSKGKIVKNNVNMISGTYMKFCIQTGAGNVKFNNIKLRVQLEKGNVSTPIEPYGYRIPINVNGQNLWDGTFIKLTINQNTVGHSGSSNQRGFEFSAKPNTTYSVMVNTTTPNLRLAATDSNYVPFVYKLYDGSKFGTITTSSNTTILAVYIGSNASVENITLMIVEGEYTSSTVPNYEPYYQPRTTNIYLNEPLRKTENKEIVSLPSGYKQLKYIESTGTQYINTGITGNQNTRAIIDFDFTLNNSTTTFTLFGSRESASSNANIGIIWGVYQGNYGLNIDFGNYSTMRAFYQTSSENTKYKADISKNGRYLYDANNNLLASNTTSNTSTFTTLDNILLFKEYGEPSGARGYTGKIYSCKIYNNDTLVRNFIPCKNSSNVVGMYDIVNNVFYGNEGTGTFTAGPNIYADYIDLETQKVYRNVKTFKLGKTTPTNDWSSAVGSNGYDRFITSFSNLGITNVGASDLGFSTHFILSSTIPGNAETSAKFNLSTSNSNIYLTFPESLLSGDLTTTSGRSIAFNNYLSNQYNSNNGVEICYPATNETQENIVLPDILLNKGTNIISIDSEVNSSDMWIKYKGKE